MYKIFVFFLGILFFLGCTSYYTDSYKPDVIVEKKIQASRKGEIIKDQKPVVVAVATHLNEVDNVIYGNREYFFVEVFSERQDIFYDGVISFTLFKKPPIWVREIKKDEYDTILSSSNKWSRSFLIAFNKLDSLASRKAKLVMDVYNFGKITFDFTYQAIPMQF
ncbi:hypothetical protein BKH41_01115 [Helicobacter sp. 12S02232-10]|uniref:hypothetical protein n=1 Tax=Helicobacter sp. 12S02232-10 TaxID=1476197 RepID=UPI000BA6037E|nr:hypothetical protein [Helicobacter sp. 12S02232-10]PAF49932.1 hypothetical protein BKH41_01115 [Helicobacter sp. 12S02232-10]